LQVGDSTTSPVSFLISDTNECCAYFLVYKTTPILKSQTEMIIRVQDHIPYLVFTICSPKINTATIKDTDRKTEIFNICRCMLK